MRKVIAAFILFALIVFTSFAVSESYKTEYGVMFGMTPQEVQDIESDHNNVLKGTWENSDSYQLYYESDIHFYSLKCSRMQYDFDVEKRLLFQVYYVSKGGIADYSYIKSFLTTQFGEPISDIQDSGKYSLLYDQLGKDDGHIDAAHWVVSDQNLGIDLWYNQYDTVFSTFYDTSNPASYGAVSKYYTDDVTGISFSYMEGWDVSLLSLPPQKIGFTLRRDTQSLAQYVQMDLWENLKEYYEPIGFKREDIGADFLEDEIVSLIMQPIVPQNLRTRTFNGIKFRLFEHQTDNNGRYPDLYYCTVALTVKDGYLHMFQLSSVSKHDQLMLDFENLLSTVTYTR